MPHIAPTSELFGRVQHYAWGSETLLPEFLGSVPDGRPHAELWLGAHPSLPALLEEGQLDELVAADPLALLGVHHDRVGNSLPFLLKVLAVGSPLSIQVHPTHEQARLGFDREEAAAIARDASHRSYRDPNHKPEIICALTNFSLLCGFVAFAEAQTRLQELHRVEPTLADLVLLDDNVEHRGAFLRALLQMDEQRLAIAMRGVASVASRRGLDYLTTIVDCYPQDRGALVALFMNHRVLRPGDAMFFEAGVVHAYLDGLGVELLANSDNVLRAGLTPKHIDVDELLSVCQPTASAPALVEPMRNGQLTTWRPPVDDFELQRVVGDSVVGPHRGPRIVLVAKSTATVRDVVTDSVQVLRRGQSAWIGPDVDLVIRNADRHEDCDVFVASSPALA